MERDKTTGTWIGARFCWYFEHDRQLGGASPLHILMEVKGGEAHGHHREAGLKEAWSKDTGRWTRTGFEAYGVGRAGN